MSIDVNLDEIFFNLDEILNGNTVIWGKEGEDGHIIWLGADVLAERAARESSRGVSRYVGPVTPVWGRWR